MIKTIIGVVGGAILALGSFFTGHITQPVVTPAPQLGSFSPTGSGTYRLQSSVGVSNTSIALSAFKEPVSNIPYTMSYLGSTVGYGTIDPQTSRSEFISFTGITQNSNGTALLTGVTRGLTRTPAGSLCTASTTLAQAHSGQSIFILSDSPCLFAEYYVLRNNATSTGILTFSSTTPPRYDQTGAQSTGTYIATTSEFASIEYVNKTSFAGTSNATESVKGISELATALEQASSTILGATGAGVVMQARYATDTPLSGCAVGYTATAGAGCSVIARLTGKIRQTWLDLTEQFTFSGKLLSTASSTFTATTTFNGSNVLSNAVIFNNVPYAFPSSQGAASSFAKNDGSGNISWATSGLTSALSTTTTFAAPTANPSTATKTVTCVSPKLVSGGGVSGIPIPACSSGNCSATTIVDNYPSSGSAWTVTLSCFTTGSAGTTCNAGTVTIYAECVNP